MRWNERSAQTAEQVGVDRAEPAVTREVAHDQLRAESDGRMKAVRNRDLPEQEEARLLEIPFGGDALAGELLVGEPDSHENTVRMAGHTLGGVAPGKAGTVNVLETVRLDDEAEVPLEMRGRRLLVGVAGDLAAAGGVPPILPRLVDAQAHEDLILRIEYEGVDAVPHGSLEDSGVDHVIGALVASPDCRHSLAGGGAMNTPIGGVLR